MSMMSKIVLLQNMSMNPQIVADLKQMMPTNAADLEQPIVSK